MKKDFWNSLFLELMLFGFISSRKFKSTKGLVHFVLLMNIWTLSFLGFWIYFSFFSPNPEDYNNIAGILLVGFAFSFLSFLYSLETFKVDKMIYLNDLNLKVGDNISFEIEDEIKEGEITTIFREYFNLTDSNGTTKTIHWSYFLENISYLVWLDNKGENKKCFQD